MIYRFNTVSIKITLTFFTEIEKTILRLIEKLKETLMAKAVVVRKSDVPEQTLASRYNAETAWDDPRADI